MSLSKFSDEENLFRESVADFAVQEIRPRVRSMDEQGKTSNIQLPTIAKLLLK